MRRSFIYSKFELTMIVLKNLHVNCSRQYLCSWIFMKRSVLLILFTKFFNKPVLNSRLVSKFFIYIFSKYSGFIGRQMSIMVESASGVNSHQFVFLKLTRLFGKRRHQFKYLFSFISIFTQFLCSFYVFIFRLYFHSATISLISQK